MREEYISYGISKFDPEKIKSDKFEINPKDDMLKNILYGSTTDPTVYNSKQFLYDMDINPNVQDYIKFKLNNAKIYTVKTFKDLLKLPVKEDNTKHGHGDKSWQIDYEKLRDMGYDGIKLSFELYPFGHHMDYEPQTEEDKNLTPEQMEKIDSLSHMFYSWNYDSIVIWNPNVIEVIEEKDLSAERAAKDNKNKEKISKILKNLDKEEIEFLEEHYEYKLYNSHNLNEIIEELTFDNPELSKKVNNILNEIENEGIEDPTIQNNIGKGEEK